MKNRKKINGYKVVSFVAPRGMHDFMKQRCETEQMIISEYLRNLVEKDEIEAKKREIAAEDFKLMRK